MRVFNKKNLGIKIVSAECALWTKIKEARVATIKQYEEALIVEKEFLKLAERKSVSYQVISIEGAEYDRFPDMELRDNAWFAQ